MSVVMIIVILVILLCIQIFLSRRYGVRIRVYCHVWETVISSGIRCYDLYILWVILAQALLLVLLYMYLLHCLAFCSNWVVFSLECVVYFFMWGCQFISRSCSWFTGLIFDNAVVLATKRTISWHTPGCRQLRLYFCISGVNSWPSVALPAVLQKSVSSPLVLLTFAM
jgi:hypothetical protein